MLRLTLAALGAMATFWGAQGAQVILGKATLVGTDIPTFRQEVFAGIPFAEPPVGKLRLKAPVPKYTLKPGKFDATKYGLGCVQPAANISLFSEDCLTINVLRPAGVPTNVSIPVMVWVYGGGFIGGTSSTYNGSAIVAQSLLRGTPVIYVSFNYRLGPLGFPQGIEAGKKGDVNLGLKDQVVALQWVQKNIKSFGGDPKLVTVFGESAGAISIAIHMLNPSFTKLARAVILESGSAASSLTKFPEARQGDWDAFVAAIPGCASSVKKRKTLTCLREANVNTTTLVQAIGAAYHAADEQYPFSPVLDGADGVFPTLPSLALASGSFAKIPFIAGTNLDEGTSFVPSPQSVSEALAVLSLRSNFTPSLIPSLGNSLLNSSINRILELYPDVPALGSPFGTGNETFGLNSNYKRIAALVTDLSFASQRRQLSQLSSQYGVKSYGYLFTDHSAASPPARGVAHGAEVYYVFGFTALSNAYSAASKALTLNIINYWVSFATSLDPNDGKGGNRTTWEQYTPDNEVLLQLDGTNTTTIPDTFRKEQIDFINQNSVVWHHRR